MRSSSVSRLDLALVVNVRLGKLVLEESFVVVPRALGRTFRQTRQVFRIGDRFSLPPRCATSVNRAKSRRSIGLLPS